MTITPEEIMAYVDGESDAADRARITRAALLDPALADRIAAERALREHLVAHYAPCEAEPVPVAWVEAIRAETGSNVVPLTSVRGAPAVAGRPVRPRWRAFTGMGATIAASLVLGISIGSVWHKQNDMAPIVARDGGLFAGGSLADALETQLASAQGGDRIRMLTTFRRRDGEICRTFAGAQASGIACRDARGWQLPYVLPGSAPSPATYRQAGSNADLMALAQDMAAGDPLDAVQERQARAKGWL